MKTPPIAFSADWHARGSDLEAFDRQLGALVDETESAGCDHHVVSGDIFDESNICDGRASTGAIIDVVSRHVKRAEFRWIIIKGDHDVSGAGSVDALTCLDKFDKVEVIREPTILRKGTAGRIPIFCVPWNWSHTANVEDAIMNLIKENPVCAADPLAVLAGHMEVMGALFNRLRANTGSASNRQWCASSEFLDGLPIKNIKLGNYHARQKFFIGALRQLNHGEEGNPAGFELWHPDTNETKWIELSEAPRYRTVKVFKGDAWPEQAPNEILRVQTIGWVPSASEVIAREDATPGAITVQPILEREERVARAEVPQGAASDPAALIELWASTQTPPVEPARIERMRNALKEIAA